MYEDTSISSPRHLLKKQQMESGDIESDCAVMENLRGNNSDSGIGIEPSRDELIPRDGSSAPKSEKSYYYQSRYDSARTDSGFESFRSDRFSSGDSSCWKISSDYIPLSPTEEQCDILGSVPTDKGYPESKTFNYERFNPSTEDVTEQMKNLQFHEPVRRTTISSDEYRQTCDLIQQNDDGDTLLHLAIIHGLIDVVSNFIQCLPFPMCLQLQNNLYQTPLHLAVITNQYEIVKKLIEAGVSTDIRERRGNTALHIACERGFSKCARAILNTGHSYPDLELINYEGQTCMHLATLNQNIEILHLLKKYGADINSHECKSGRTPLHYAVEIQNFEIVNFLVKECTADTNSRTFAGFTPIQFTYNRNKKIEQYLVDSGANDVGIASSDSESDSSSDEISKMDTLDDSEMDFHVNGQPLTCH